MPYVTQSRSLPRPMADNIGRWYWTGSYRPTTQYGGSNPGGSQTTFSYRGSAERDYSRMSGPDLRKNLRSDYISRYDTGHEFNTDKLETLDENIASISANIRLNVYYPKTPAVLVGRFVPIIADGGSCTMAPNSTDQLDKWGRAAIAKTVPTAPEAGVMSAFIELREGLPKLVGASLAKNGLKAKGLHKAVGEEFLNVEFGYKPLVGDIVKSALAVVDFEKRLGQLRKDSEQVVRRRAQLASEQTAQVVPLTGTNVLGPYLPFMNTGTGNVNMTSEVIYSKGAPQRLEEFSSDVWFAGAYSYYLHQGNEFHDKVKEYAQLAHMLLGADLSPETVWQVTPWSWLFDWFADTSVFMRNITELQPDSSVLRYGYIMSTSKTTWTYIVPDITPQIGASCPTVASVTRQRVIKQRRKATPYGFGLDIGAFSSRRWSVLGALGMTKSDRVLKS